MLVPAALIAVLVLHHSLSMVVGIPLILHYRKLKILHALCFTLQAAAAVAVSIAEFTKLLDVSKPKQLKLFQVLTMFTFVIMVITRVFVWFYLIFKFAMVWYEDSAWGFMTVGLIMASVFTFFNWVACIVPCYKSIIKFRKL